MMLRPTLLCLLVALGLTTPSAFGHVRGCALPAGVRAVVASKDAVIGVQRRGAYRGDVYACHRRRGKFYKIGSSYDAARAMARVRAIRLAGRYAGLIQEGAGRSTVSTQIRVFDLVRGRPVHEYAVRNSPRGAGEMVPTATDLELRPNGSAAWILQWDTFDESRTLAERTYEVWKAERGRPDALLDSGGAIAARSLALSGHLLYWTNGDEPRRAFIQ